MRLHAVCPGGGAPRRWPLIAYLAATVQNGEPSSVLAGDSGDGGKQLRQGGGGGTHLLAVGLPLGATMWNQWSPTELDFNFF